MSLWLLWPLPGSGHHTLPAPLDCSPSRNSTPASKQVVGYLPRAAWRQEDEHCIFSGSQLGFSSSFQNDTSTHTLSPGGKLPHSQPSSLSFGVGQTPATFCQGGCYVSLATGMSWEEGEGGRGSVDWLIPQITPAPPSAACPLKELLLNSKLVRRVNHQRK